MPSAVPASRRRRVLFVALGLLLLWGLAELVAFVAFGFAFGEGYSPSRLRAERVELTGQGDDAPDARRLANTTNWTLHPYLGYVLDPDDVSDARLGSALDVSDWGFRDDGPPFRHRGPDEVIVGLVGGSVAAMFAEDGVRALERGLRAAPGLDDKRIVFVHLAVPGYRQPQQLLAVDLSLAQGGEFDAIVDISGLNEITRPLQVGPSAGIHPLFPSNWRFLAADALSPDVQRAIGGATYNRELRRDWAARFEGGWFSWSVLANTIWKAYDRVLERRVSDYNAAARAASDAGTLPYQITGPRHGLDTELEQLTYGADVWARSAELLHQQCRARGVRAFVFLQPNQYVPDSKPMGEAERAVAWLPDHPTRRIVEQGYPLLQELGRALAANGVAFHDLTRIFESVTEPLYIDSCCHLNRRGNELMALAIAEIVAPVLASDIASAPRPKVVDVAVEPARVALDRPFATGRMTVIGRTADGTTRDVTYACREFRSSAPDVVTVDHYGDLVALREGTATVTARHAEQQQLVLEVTVGFPDVVVLDNDAPRDDDPALAARIDGDAVEVRLQPAPAPGAVGWLVVGTEPRRTPYCREDLFVDLTSGQRLPVTPDAVWRLPIAPDMRGRTIYLQAAMPDESLPCRIRTTDALAVTPR